MTDPFSPTGKTFVSGQTRRVLISNDSTAIQCGARLDVDLGIQDGGEVLPCEACHILGNPSHTLSM